MKKLLTLVIVFSLALVLNNVSFAEDAAAPVAPPTLSVTVEEGTIVQGQDCDGSVLPHRSCLFRPFVHRACTPCIATPCQPCPPEPACICASVPRKLCGAPIQPPCFAAPSVAPCGDPCVNGYEGYERFPRLHGFFSRLFSKCHSADPYYGYPTGCSCEQQQPLPQQ